MRGEYREATQADSGSYDGTSTKHGEAVHDGEVKGGVVRAEGQLPGYACPFNPALIPSLIRSSLPNGEQQRGEERARGPTQISSDRRTRAPPSEMKR